MKPLVSIIILNYMTYELTIRCYDLLKEQIYDNMQVIIVDNASPNSSSKVLKDHCESKGILFLESTENGGYAKGNNIGIRKALELGSKYVFIMNNDIKLPERNYLTKVVEYFESNPNVGLMGPVIYTNGIKDMALMNERPNWKQEMLTNFIRIPLWLVGKWHKKINLDQEDQTNTIHNVTHTSQEVRNVYAVSGCCMFFTGACLKEIEGFDEGTFLYNEEAIIGEKCFRKKIPVVYDTNFYILHEHGATIKKHVQMRRQCIFEETSRMYYYKKFRDDIPKWGYILLIISSKFNRHINIPIIHYFDNKKNG